MRHNMDRGIMGQLMTEGRIIGFRRRARLSADEDLARGKLDAVGRGAIIGPTAAVGNGCAGRGDEGLGLFDWREDRCGSLDRRRGPAVDLLGREHRRGAGEQTRVGLIAVFAGDGEFLVEDDIGRFLALADLRSGFRPLLVRAPDAG